MDDGWALALTSLAVNALNILKNPTILLALVSLGIFIGMPYLVDNSMETTTHTS
jgi:hypothetical protein